MSKIPLRTPKGTSVLRTEMNTKAAIMREAIGRIQTPEAADSSVWIQDKLRTKFRMANTSDQWQRWADCCHRLIHGKLAAGAACFGENFAAICRRFARCAF